VRDEKRRWFYHAKSPKYYEFGWVSTGIAGYAMQRRILRQHSDVLRFTIYDFDDVKPGSGNVR
jgi:hypothetical protein